MAKTKPKTKAAPVLKPAVKSEVPEKEASVPQTEDLKKTEVPALEVLQESPMPQTDGSKETEGTEEASTESEVKVVVQLPIQEQIIVGTLEEYSKVMGGKSTPTKEVTRAQQIRLYRAIVAITVLETERAEMRWKDLLTRVWVGESEAFSPMNIARSLTELGLQPSEVREFEQLLTVVTKTANPAHRSEMAEVINIEAVCNWIIDERSIEFLYDFYN